MGSGNLPYLPCLPFMKSSNKIAMYMLILNSVLLFMYTPYIIMSILHAVNCAIHRHY